MGPSKKWWSEGKWALNLWGARPSCKITPLKYHLGSKNWRRLDLQKLWKFLSIIQQWATYSCVLPFLFFAWQGPNVIYLAFGLFWSNCLSKTTSSLTLSEDSCTFDLVLFNLRAVRMAHKMLTNVLRTHVVGRASTVSMLNFVKIGRAPKGNYYSNSNHPFPIASLFLVIFVQDLSHDDSMCDNDPYKMPHQLKGPITPLTVEKYIAQSLHIGFYGPFTNLPFWGCAMYFDHKV